MFRSLDRRGFDGSHSSRIVGQPTRPGYTATVVVSLICRPSRMAKSSPSKGGAISALDFLTSPDKCLVGCVCAIFGDEAYLKREVLTALRRQLLGSEGGEFAYTTLSGRETQLREVFDALATVSLFSTGPRLVVIEEADPFVTMYRAELEDYVSKPSRDGVLALEVKLWASNTRLAKAVGAAGLSIECKSPDQRSAKRWLKDRAHSEHGVKLEAAAADALFELLPHELGILDQEVAKLALLAGGVREISLSLVREHVGGWRTRTTWEMVDAVADGRASDALVQLDRLISAGEKPQGILPQMSASLRKFATAVRLIHEAEADRRKLPLQAALKEAGVPPFKLSEAERQLRRIGRERALQLTEWLLSADLAMKGHNSSDPRARIELERLILRVASTDGDRSPAGAGSIRR